MADEYNPASLRVKELSPGTFDKRGVVTLYVPEGTAREYPRGAVALNFMPGVGSSGGAIVIGEVPTGTIDGANTIFTLDFTPVGGIMLWRDAVLMYPAVHYILSGNTITYLDGNQPGTGGSHMTVYQHA